MQSIASNLNPGWGQATASSEFQIAGNNTLEYANLNYQGMEYPETDVSAWRYVHLDYYTNDATALEFSLISPGPEKTLENAYDIAAEEVCTGQWVSVDIPLIEVYGARIRQSFPIQNCRKWNGLFGQLVSSQFWRSECWKCSKRSSFKLLQTRHQD